MTDQPMPPNRRPGPSRRVPPPPPQRPGPGARPGVYQPPQAWSARPDAPRQAPPARPSGPPPRPAGNENRYAPTQRPEPIPVEPQRRSRGTDRGNGQQPPPPPRKPSTSDRPKPPRPKRKRRRHIGKIALSLVVLLLVGSVGLLFYYDGKLHRVAALTAYAGRVADTPGTNWLIVGTDSRADLSQAQRNRLATGDSDGSRTDTIMLVHKPPSGTTMIISIPRDLYVPIPGQGSHKINSAFNFGGPHLLVQTVETLTGVHIDHFGEIGFGGFDTLVDAVGGVNMCLNQALNDPKAGLRLKAGCQDLNGKQALGLVRTRAFPNADLERVVNQRKFLSALMSKATSPGVLLNPFALFPFINGAIDSLTVDENDHIWHLAGLAFALRSNPITTTVPTGGSEYTSDGDSLAVGDNTKRFFEAIASGRAVDKDLLSESGGAVK
ncbi:LCP family protein [Gordonia effusa]|uniref:LCP family protein n=1 Tax=Gordonia effusa TaxID=263908 RepID=UPI0009FF99B2|nr:LCP family protein [Gordonia effusa]